MMSRICVVLALFFVVARSAHAQIGFSQGVWLRGTTVTVINDIEDQKTVQILVNDRKLTLVYPGEARGGKIGGGLFIFENNYVQLALTVQVCEAVARIPLAPPAWVMDGNLLPEPMTESYLRTASEGSLRKANQAAKKILDQRGMLGRKEMKRELDRWFNEIKKYGLGAAAQTCVRPIQSFTQPVSAWGGNYYTYTQAFTFHVRGSTARGYSFGQ